MSLSVFLSILGMSIGVASLVLAMAVISGYETTLKKSVIDSFGHVIVSKRGGGINDEDPLIQRLKSSENLVTGSSPFLYVESVLAHGGSVSGVLLEGLDTSTIQDVVSLEHRLIAGEFDLTPKSLPGVIIGKGVSERFQLEVGDTLSLVIPISSVGAAGFRPRLQRFEVRGVLSLGRHDYDERYLLTDIKTAQQFLGSDRISGYRLRLVHEDRADEVSAFVGSEFGYPYWTRTWFESNQNLFQAVSYEKAIIFIIVLLMVVAASINISVSLFLSVLRRYADIGVLKAMGASPKFIQRLFTIQGLFIGFIGAFLGLLLGKACCEVFMWVQSQFSLFPAEIYKIDSVDLELRLWDIFWIFVSSFVICFLSTLAPAKKGARLSAVEGLRYE